MGMQVQGFQPISPMAKKLIIANVAIWFFGVILFEALFLEPGTMFHFFGLIPEKTIFSFWLWQPVTYMFFHSAQIFHILFNMLLLWWLGSELELRWGPKFFLTYYMVCGIGAGLIFLAGAFIYYGVTQDATPLMTPLVGASGAVFGLMLAYGMVFGERMIYFMLLFPMKAKYFVLLIGAIEVVTLINTGIGNKVANLAHLAGLLVGYLYLKFYSRWQAYKIRRKTKKHGRNFRVVVNNDKPKYWN